MYRLIHACKTFPILQFLLEFLKVVFCQRVLRENFLINRVHLCFCRMRTKNIL